VEFVVGPSQQTLMAHTFTEPIQLAFIDGPHGYPFPELEYFKLYPHIETGRTAVVDDIHIPTIRNLFNFLRKTHGCLPSGGKDRLLRTHQRPTFSNTGDAVLRRINSAGLSRFPYHDLNMPQHDSPVFKWRRETEADPR
jgi:hypothetical protein